VEQYYTRGHNLQRLVRYKTASILLTALFVEFAGISYDYSIEKGGQIGSDVLNAALVLTAAAALSGRAAIGYILDVRSFNNSEIDVQ